ncbi:MAG: dihydroorotase [Deltaproteobacteria bacterium]|nr:MAG: dihydroorotase [Deltaproteobacteria bacterium]
MNLIIKKGRVIDPGSDVDDILDVIITDGNIAAIGYNISSEFNANKYEVIDATGKWVVPGLIDIHVHLREPGQEYKETISSGSKAAVAGGFTSIACMPNTDPVNDRAAVTEFILDKARECGICNVYPVGAVSKGLEGKTLAEVGELFEAGVVGVTDDGFPVRTSQLMRRILEYSKIFGFPVISHAEDLSLSAGGVMNEGAVSTKLGLKGIPKAAEEIAVFRDIALAELTGGKLHIAHVSTAGSVELIRRAKERGIPVTAETAPHYFTLTDDALSSYDTNFKMNPPLREKKDVEAIKEGLADGTIDAIATDHAPHNIIDKDVEFEYAANGIIGLESALPISLRLVWDGTLSPFEFIKKLTSNPAKILGISGGTIGVNKSADITVIDPDAEYTIDTESFYSKSRNCPFHGWKVKGKVWITIKEGQIFYRNGTVLSSR